MKQTYCYNPEVRYFPVASSEVFYSPYRTEFVPTFTVIYLFIKECHAFPFVECPQNKLVPAIAYV